MSRICKRNYSYIDMLTKIMVLTGSFAAFMVISYYIININEVIDRLNDSYNKLVDVKQYTLGSQKIQINLVNEI